MRLRINCSKERAVFPDPPVHRRTWIKTNMAPLRGWGTRGERLISHVPHGHWQTMTFIGASRHDRIDGRRKRGNSPPIRQP
jgi:hypothetical protein